MSGITTLSLAEIAAAVASRKISAVEVVRAHLDRIAALDGKLRSFITVCGEQALAAARLADGEVRAGTHRPLHGVPLGIKDLCDTKGVLTTAGSRVFAGRIPTRDATVVERLVAAGAIVLGKLNMNEIAYGPDGKNDHFGTPWNPWDAQTHRLPGGSSSGSAVAVVAGLCAGATGSDTGGSIRVPSSLCGLTGLKTTYGLVSRAGVMPLAWSMDTIGPMSRSAADAALMLAAMAGPDARDATTAGAPALDLAAPPPRDLRGLRVGVVIPFFLEHTVPSVRQAVERAAKMFAELGAAVAEENTGIPTAPHARAAYSAICWPEALSYHEPFVRTRPDDYEPGVRDLLRLGATVSATQYLKAQRVRQVMRAETDALFKKYDVLLTPATPMTALPVDQMTVEISGKIRDRRPSLIRFTQVFNLTGHPATVFPCGFDAGGLPVGLQIVGRPFADADLLRIASVYQGATDWHTRRPGGS